MNYNQKTQTGNVIMPLLMGCTQSTQIKILESETPIVYDPISQTTILDMRILGTKSLKTTTIKVAGSTKQVQKNEIDDKKNV